jgi:hypothetical protein
MTVSGSAPSFPARAWALFATVPSTTLNGSGNVSSLSDLAVGRTQINFATAMPSANYSVAGIGSGGGFSGETNVNCAPIFAGSVIYITTNDGGVEADRSYCSFVAFH